MRLWNIIDTQYTSHTVESTNSFCHDFYAKIPSNQSFTTELYYNLIWRKKICVAVNFSFFHTVQVVWQNEIFTLTKKKCRQNTSIVTSFVKPFWFHEIFTNKAWEQISAIITTTQCGNYEIFLSLFFGKISWK